MSLDSPLFLTKVECPICGTLNEFETIRVGAYTEGDRDTDFYSGIIKWRNPKYQKYNPLLFFTGTCSSCFYTREFSQKYRDWHKDNNFLTYRRKIIKEKHLAGFGEEGSLLKTIGRLLDLEHFPDETAILKLVLAAYDELLYDHPSNLDLGRFYLRIAWMFRYMVADELSGEKAAYSPFLDDISRGIDDLDNWLAGLGRNNEFVKNAVGAYLEAGGEESHPESKKYLEVVDRLTALEAEGLQAVNALKELTTGSKGIEGGKTTTSDDELGNCSNFGDLLNSLFRRWDGIPRNENEAIRMAVRYYIMAFETGKEISHGNQSIQAGYLIAELSRRIGDHDTARQYFNNTIKSGQDFIREIKGDRTRTALARKILEMALAQGKRNLAEAK